jgi:hypothetical protein
MGRGVVMSFHPHKCTVIRIATNQRHVIPTQYTLHRWISLATLLCTCSSLWISADECGSQTVDAYSSGVFKIIHELVDVQTDVIRTGDSRTRGSNRLYQPVACFSCKFVIINII